MQFDPVAVMLFISGLAFSGLIAFALFSRGSGAPTGEAKPNDALVFLLRDSDVVDTNFGARRVIDSITGPSTDAERLQLFLSNHFDDVDRLLANAAAYGDASDVSRDGQSQILREVAGDTVRLQVNFVSDTSPNALDVHSLRALENELALLRANTSAAPFLLWRQNRAGEITWVNRAYLETVRTFCALGSDVVWPLPRLFPSLQPLADANDGEPQRIAVHGKGLTEDAWYDCHVTAIGNDVLCTAIPADEAVRADNRRREFTQTLTKTFAELAIGLAIFDRSRRLVLFNPALLDLTNMPTDFLTSRPSMVSFLDHLRENRVMPEPRDYRTWRTAIAELEAAAVDGTYSETWSLPDGQTYHVTGRPHPDGAVALLFEDISAEVSLTRRFRAELEQSQSVLDAVTDAVALFSPAGQLILVNQAYRTLWRTDPDEVLGSIDIAEATRRWHELSAPTPVWGDFRDFAQMSQEREEWSANVQLIDGRSVACRFVPQKAGATMVLFQVQRARALAESELRQTG